MTTALFCAVVIAVITTKIPDALLSSETPEPNKASE